MTAQLAPDVTVPHHCTVTDVCKALGWSRATFYRRLQAGRLGWLRAVQPALDTPRYRGADIVAYLNGTLDHSRSLTSHRRRA